MVKRNSRRFTLPSGSGQGDSQFHRPRKRGRRLWHARRCLFEPLERRVLLAGDINFSVGDEIRNYRLAVATTEEYTTAIGGEAAALASVNELVADFNKSTRVNWRFVLIW